MNWQTPKVDWASGDVVGITDLNRFEGNPRANRKRFEVSGNVNLSGTVPATSFYMQQFLYFSVEDDERLVLKNARYRWFSSGLKLRVVYDIGGGTVVAFTSASHEGDEEPDQVIYSNTTGSPVTGWYAVQAYNPTGGGLSISQTDGWSLTFEKEDV